MAEIQCFGRSFSTRPKDWKQPSTAGRTVPMQVLVLGPPRTGTSSMVEALRLLGYNDIHHMSSCISQSLENAQWSRALKAKFFREGESFTRKDWDMLLGDCMAVTDFPAAAFAEELLVAYPDAKVILNTRDVNSWYTSIVSTIGVARRSFLINFFVLSGDPFFSRWIPMTRLLWAGRSGTPDPMSTFLAPALDEELVKQRFVEHYDRIRALVPKERLYERNITEGWDGLCQFLGKEIPGCPYPRVNDREEFRRSMEVMVKAGLGRLGWCALQLALLVALMGVSMFFGLMISDYRSRF